MNNLDIAELIELTESGKTEEAVKIVSSFFAGLSAAEKGQAYVAMGSMYLKLIAENQRELAAVLDLQLQQLKEIDQAEQEIVEEIELEQARAQLSE